MPTPIESFIEATRPRIKVGLAPVHNAIHSLLLLTEAERLSGLGDWVIKTANQLSIEEAKKHNAVMQGFYFAILPRQDWRSFPLYLQHLEEMEPENLRRILFQGYTNFPIKDDVLEIITPEEAFSSADKYIQFLLQRFDDSKFDEKLERWAYEYIIDPPAMQELIVTHLRKYWDLYLQPEWERILPTLQKAVDALSSVDFSQMDNYEAVKFVIGQAAADEKWEHTCEKTDGLYFVPSLHVGPYVGKFKMDDHLGIIFGAGSLDSIAIAAPELSQADIYVRLNALADENRLQILKYISDNGESCSTEIIDVLDLSQSAASRHLTQLTAIGYLTARRKNGAKCYQLDKERIGSTLETIKGYLNID
jgi:DNA-binding transcriptional ArsR family regulator